MPKEGCYLDVFYPAETSIGNGGEQKPVPGEDGGDRFGDGFNRYFSIESHLYGFSTRFKSSQGHCRSYQPEISVTSISNA